MNDHADLSETSDGYHTFGELYAHRAALFAALTSAFPGISWKSREHNDGTMFDGMFIVGMQLPTGQVTYHYHLDLWDDFPHAKVLPRGLVWDDHTPQDVVDRLREWAKQ